MGIKALFQEDFHSTVQSLYLAVREVELEPFVIVSIREKVYVHLIPLSTTFKPQQLLSLQAIYQQKGLTLVHLWEDVWLNKKAQVLSRIHSFCGQNVTVHGRKAKIVELEKSTTESFLAANHLQGYIKTKYNYGLTVDGTLTAAACFSATRPMTSKGAHYHSAELIRFATLTGFTIVGGLSKLISNFIKQVPVNDLMTYADRDWSLGKGYDKLNFALSGITPPVFFFLNEQTNTRYLAHRIPKKIQTAFDAQDILNLNDFLQENGFLKIFNTGNLKYHLYT